MILIVELTVLSKLAVYSFYWVFCFLFLVWYIHFPLILSVYLCVTDKQTSNDINPLQKFSNHKTRNTEFNLYCTFVFFLFVIVNLQGGERKERKI